MVGGGWSVREEDGGAGLAELEKRMWRGIEQHFLLPKEVLDVLGPDSAQRDTGWAPEALGTSCSTGNPSWILGKGLSTRGSGPRVVEDSGSVEICGLDKALHSLLWFVSALGRELGWGLQRPFQPKWFNDFANQKCVHMLDNLHLYRVSH